MQALAWGGQSSPDGVLVLCAAAAVAQAQLAVGTYIMDSCAELMEPKQLC